MSAAIEIQKTDDGIILARRLDGKPLTPADKAEAERMARMDTTTEPAADDPLMTVEQWYPEFHRLHMAVVAESKDFDYRRVKENQPELYAKIKAVEGRIDGLETARLSAIMDLMREWRELILHAQVERRPRC